MQSEPKKESAAHRATQIIADAGGKIVGRTRFQKIAYLLESVGLGAGFSFEYKHYGPFSDHLSQALRTAELIGLITEKEKATEWGGFYSVYELEADDTSAFGKSSLARKQILDIARDADSVELELAATALFLQKTGVDDPWEETRARKPTKATSARLSNARDLYKKLRGVKVPKPLPVF